MKRILSLVLSLALLLACFPALPIATQAATTASGSCGTDLSWKLTDDGTLTISGTGLLEEYVLVNFVPWYEYKESVKTVIIEDGVENVCKYAFYEFTNLERVIIGNSVTKIGERAFYHCKNLTRVEIPASVTKLEYDAFSGCTNLKRIIFKGNAPSFHNYTFYEVTAIACYPAGDGTWTEDKRDHYAGVIDWVAYGPNGIIAEGKCGDTLKWTLTTDGNLSIIGKGAMYGYSDSGSPWYSYSIFPQKLFIDNGVTSIGDYAFQNLDGLTHVTIPDSITIIGKSAFWGCDRLAGVTIPDSVTSIGNSAFRACESLTDIVIPDSVTTLDRYAFYGCVNLNKITFEGNAPLFGSNIFGKVTATVYYPVNYNTWTADVMQNYGGKITWTSYLRVIASGTCGENLTWRLTPDGTLTISGTGQMYDYGFSSPNEPPWKDNRISIKTVIIEDGVTTIGNYAFYNHANLTNVMMPNTLVSIGDSAFDRCTGLTNVTIPASVTKIDKEAFRYCPSLLAIIVQEDNTHYSSDQNGVLFSKNKEKLIRFPGGKEGEYNVPDSVEDIEDYSFYGCQKLTNVVIANAVTQIGTYAFYACENLCSVTIGNSVEGIGSYAFYECSKLSNLSLPDTLRYIGPCAFCDVALTEVTIPELVESIGVWAFSGCLDLREINFKGDAPNIGDNAFNAVTATAYYPASKATWTEPVRQNYGGKITWFADCTDGHAEITDEGYDATCTTDGLTEGKHCSACGEIIVPQEVIPARHTYTAHVVPSTCTEKGYTTHTCHCGDSYVDSYQDALGHNWGEWYELTESTPYADGTEQRDCDRCEHFETQTISYRGNGLKLSGDDFANQDTVWIEGIPYPVQGKEEERYVELPSEADCYMVTYTYHAGDGQDIHTQYPTGMKVYLVKDGKITHIPELDNLLQYSGASIRITGKKGIRMITSIEKAKKTALTGKGLAGYKLLEYGTALCFASEIPEGDALVLGRDFTRSNYAYKKGKADPVFASTKDLIQYTNVLVGFSLEQCKDDIAMRPYIVLEDAQGNQVTLYGGTIYRSIGYIAYQNRTVFKPKTASYNYVWEIIHHVYGDKYDADYKG